MPTNPPPTATPTPTPTATSTPAVDGTQCVPNGLSIGRNPQSSAVGVVGADGILRIMPRHVTGQYMPGQLAMQYHLSQSASADRASLAVARGGASNVIADLRFPHSDLATRILKVDPSQLDAMATALRSQPGVIRVDRVGARSLMTSNQYFTNDPYFNGHNVTPAGQPGGPLYTSPTYPGQWDMHIMGLENVFGYSQPGNVVLPNPNALGSAAIKLAVIDTGMDISLTDIGPASASRIARTECYITVGSTQTNTQNVSDFDGHGTNVTGIAAANTNNGFAFASTGGNVSLMLYRIFPSGANPNASVADEVAAINDAVANGAKIISMSLGSSTPDPTEQTAVLNAIAAGVTVVAASGNETAAKLDFPAGYAGVVAVGASAIDDFGTERVASYSNYDSSNSANWGLIAPGGDPTGNTDSDFNHWIENTYSLRATQPCRAATGGLDFYGESGNCNVLIAGTSQATPHVAGAVAMLFSVGGVLSPAATKTALFNASHNIGDAKQGAGRLNEYYLIAKALGDSALPPL